MVTTENVTKTAPPTGRDQDFDEWARPQLEKWELDRDNAQRGAGFGPCNELFTPEEWEAEREFSIERERYRLWLAYAPIRRALSGAYAEIERLTLVIEAGLACGEVHFCPKCRSSQLYCPCGERLR
jgi:hypothetical protein